MLHCVSRHDAHPERCQSTISCQLVIRPEGTTAEGDATCPVVDALLGYRWVQETAAARRLQLSLHAAQQVQLP